MDGWILFLFRFSPNLEGREMVQIEVFSGKFTLIYVNYLIVAAPLDSTHGSMRILDFLEKSLRRLRRV